ncbi:hypothetical protein FRB97_007303 [Tulasnella sp. 331]|nr:hypothetical protein FRB97_007303 [Tulasnella sp. 331]
MDNLPVITGRKRVLSDGDDDVLTPKKARSKVPPTPTSAKSRNVRLPTQLQHVHSAYIAIEEALIPALASNGVAAPTMDKTRPGLMNILHVLTHFTVPGLSLDNLKRLVYLLEWDHTSDATPRRPSQLPNANLDDPFVAPGTSADWTRGGHGVVVSQTTHLNRSTGRRCAAYAIGIQIESDSTPKGKGRVGMNTVTRWLERGSERKAMVELKLQRWVEVHKKAAREPFRMSSERATSPTPVQMPAIPMAILPSLTSASTSSPIKSPTKSPVKRALISSAFSTPTKSVVPFPTPDQTPDPVASSSTSSVPSTPQKDRDVRTPSTARRDALKERIRQRSLQTNGSPTKGSVVVTLGTEKDGTPREKLVSRQELKRRLVLGRLESIAECIASLLSGSRVGSSSNSPYKRKIMRLDEVVRVIVKSAKLPISEAEATEAVELLMSLCPTFVSPKIIDREMWLEMPTAVIPAPSFGPSPIKEASSIPSTPRKARPIAAPRSPSGPSLRSVTPSSPSRRVPPSPGRLLPQSPGSRLTKDELEEELMSRRVGEGSPRRVRPALVGRDGKELMTLRDSFASSSSRLMLRTRPVARTLTVSRCMATAAEPSQPVKAAVPPPAPLPTPDAKIRRIVDDISGLSLLQAADLVTLLKTRLNIQEIAMPVASAGAAPVAAAPAEDAPAAEERPKEKTMFNVQLVKFDPAQKPKIIKEVKVLNPTMSLIEAKKFVESAPKTLKENVTKEEAEKLKKLLEDLGATIALE